MCQALKMGAIQGDRRSALPNMVNTKIGENNMKKVTIGAIMLAVSLVAFLSVASGSPASPNQGYVEQDPPSPHGSAIIDNGLIQMGINDEGHLNVWGGTPSSGTGTTAVGLRYMPTNAESTAPGCLCEGWGVADVTSSLAGFANEDEGGAINMQLVSFVSDVSSATSIVDIPNSASPILRVQHYYHPSATPNLYQVDVSITNMGGAPVDLRYRRVMDWDIEPTAFSEFVTIDTGTATNIYYTSDNGFASANPLSGPSSLGFTGSFVDAGPDDHGALFDFNFGTLAPGETKEFVTFYGAAATEPEANAALAAVGAEAYSYGQANVPDGPTLGVPNTFIFAFKGVGGAPIYPSEEDIIINPDENPINVGVDPNPISPPIEVIYTGWAPGTTTYKIEVINNVTKDVVCSKAGTIASNPETMTLPDCKLPASSVGVEHIIEASAYCQQGGCVDTIRGKRLMVDAAINPIPEIATFGLVGTGLIGLVLLRRKK